MILDYGRTETPQNPTITYGEGFDVPRLTSWENDDKKTPNPPFFFQNPPQNFVKNQQQNLHHKKIHPQTPTSNIPQFRVCYIVGYYYAVRQAD